MGDDNAQRQGQIDYHLCVLPTLRPRMKLLASSRCFQAIVVANLALSQPAIAQTQQIGLPDVLAIELPRGVSKLGPNDSPLRELLSQAHFGSLAVTTDLKRNVGVGPVLVTWTAWQGAPGVGKPVAARAGTVIVLPFGMTPVGMSGDENATGGNNAARIARDSAGYVHMMWVDSGRPGGHTGPVYRRAAMAPDGSVRFETGPVYVAEGSAQDWNAYPALAASEQNVQLAWQGAGTAHTRRLSFGPRGWVFGPIRDTGAKSEGRDVGPAVVVDSQRVHIVTPSGVYAFSNDGGTSWKTEPIPLPPGDQIKTASLAVDPSGVVHIAMSVVVTRISAPNEKLGGYWQLRTIERSPAGVWSDGINVLANDHGWEEPRGPDDVLADWVRIASDSTGALHLTWHGTRISRKFGNDDAYYAWRKPGGSWQTPIQLVPQDPTHGVLFSYAPSLALDGDRALALTFYNVLSNSDWVGFDTALATLRNGRMETPLRPVTQFVRAAIDARQPQLALSSRFPAAAPTVWRTWDGHTWLDVLELFKSPLEPDANLVVYQRLNLANGPR